MNDAAAGPTPQDPDLDRVLAACAEKLPPASAWSAFTGHPDGLALAVIDAIWSVGIRYTTTRGVVTRYTAYRRLAGADAATDGLTELLGVYDLLGGTDAVINQVGTRHRVSTRPGAALKGEAVHQAATALHHLGIDTAAQFRASQDTDLGMQAEAAWKAVPGQGSGISWRYLRMLLGIADVKPDRMVKRFITSALGPDERPLPDDRIVDLVKAAAALHGADPRALDHEIWTHQTTAPPAAATTAGAEHLVSLAQAFIGRAFPILLEQHVLPVSRFQPLVRVGHHYQGSDIMNQPEFRELESALENAYPERFAEPTTRANAEFPNSYVFGFLEAAIAGCAYDGGTFEADSVSVAEAADELITVLDSKEYSLHSCRAVSHITTTGPEPVRIGDVTVYPEAASRPRDLAKRAHDHIPGIAAAFSGDLPFLYGPPHALLVSSTSVVQGNDPDEARHHASAAIDRFMLLARLLHAGTHRSGWQVTGASTLIAPIHPRATEFAGVRLDLRLQRTVPLSADDASAFAALSRYIDSAVVKRDGMTTTSFDTALRRYNRAHEAGDDFERIVDLATALEAVLTGDDKGEGLSLRLRSRAAALLATPMDSGTVIYNDITKLYDLRSRLIHGGSMSEKDFRKLIMGISTVPDDAMFGVALAFAVDRMRDLVRRSFLARLCLASGTTPLWPFGQSTPVDAALADDTTRTHWRNHWHDQLTTLGAATAADPATPGTDPITRRSTA